MRRLGALLAAALLAAFAVPAVAEELEDRIDDVAGDIARLEERLEGTEASRSSLAGTILENGRRLDRMIADVTRAEADLAYVEQQVADNREILTAVRSQLEAQYSALEHTRVELQTTRERARRRALDIYMGGGQDLGTVVFAVDGVGELSVGLQYASEVMASTDRLVNGLAALETSAARQAGVIAEREAELTGRAAELRAQRQRMEELRTDLAARKAAVEEELAAQRDRLRELEEEVEHFEGELESLAREEARLRTLLEERQAAEAAAAAEEEADADDADGDDGGDGADEQPSTGRFVRPVPGPITSPFGWRVHPIYGTRRLHAGVDMTASHGTPIKAAAGGRVILATYYGGYGNAVVIDHGAGLATLYAHQSSLAVGLGAQVSAGQVIGHVGSTGLSTGAHLHFEVRVNGTPVDPVPYL